MTGQVVKGCVARWEIRAKDGEQAMRISRMLEIMEGVLREQVQADEMHQAVLSAAEDVMLMHCDGMVCDGTERILAEKLSLVVQEELSQHIEPMFGVLDDLETATGVWLTSSPWAQT